MKKLVLLAAMLAMMLVALAPAMAQDISQDLDQDTESGGAEQSFTITGGGSNGNQCVGLNGVSNTGNNQSQTGSTQYNSDTGEVENEDSGSDLTVSGDSSTECEQEVNQAAAAGGATPKEAPKKVAPAPAPAPKPAPAPVKAETPKAKAAAPAPVVKAETPKATATAPVPKAETPKAKAETPPAKAETPKAKAAAPAPAPAPKAKASAPKELPKTGGNTAPLLALGSGILLVAGGLLARRIAK